MLKPLVTILALIAPCAALSDDVASLRYLKADGQTQITTTADATFSTPFAIASVGKTMTAVAILRLVDRGVLSLNDPANRHLPADIAQGLGGLDGVTLRHLLTMTSGLPDYLTDAYVDAVLDRPNGIQTHRDALRFAFGVGALFRVGTEFDYSNTNYVLAGAIAEAATGKSYSDIIQNEVFHPAAMQDAIVFGAAPLPHDFPSGHEDGEHYRDYYNATGLGDGGVIASAQDLANFYRALFVDRALLSDAMMAELLHDPMDVGYGMGIEMNGPVVGHAGGDLGFSSDVRLNTITGTLAILLIAQGNANTDWPSDIVGSQ